MTVQCIHTVVWQLLKNLYCMVLIFYHLGAEYEDHQHEGISIFYEGLTCNLTSGIVSCWHGCMKLILGEDHCTLTQTKDIGKLKFTSSSKLHHETDFCSIGTVINTVWSKQLPSSCQYLIAFKALMCQHYHLVLLYRMYVQHQARIAEFINN